MNETTPPSAAAMPATENADCDSPHPSAPAQPPRTDRAHLEAMLHAQKAVADAVARMAAQLNRPTPKGKAK